MVQSRSVFLETFAFQAKQILSIHKVKGKSEVLNVTIEVDTMLTEVEITRMMTNFSSWVKGNTYTQTNKTLTGYISNQDVIGSVVISVILNAFIVPGELAASPEFNTSYTAGIQIESGVTRPFHSLTGDKFFTEYGYYEAPTNDSFTTSSTTTTTSSTTTTTTTTTVAPTTTTTTAH